MYARVNVLEGTPDQIDAMFDEVREWILPRAKELDGFRGVAALGDRQSGKALGITFWESEEAMHASEEVADHGRTESAEVSGEDIASVETYEVGIIELES